MQKKVAFRLKFLYLFSTENPVPRIEKAEGVSLVKKALLTLLLAAFALAFAPVARSQAGPVEGGHELQVWTGGGHGVNGSQSGDGVWNVGFRYGLILTKPRGPGFLRGRLEYAIDAVPVFLVVQKTNTAYGAGITPFAFKW